MAIINKQKIKFFLKRILLKLMSRLDHAYAVNTTAHIQEASASTVANSLSQVALYSFTPTIVFNQDSAISNAQMLEIQLCCIFKNKALTTHQQQYYNYLLPKLNHFANAQEMISHTIKQLYENKLSFVSEEKVFHDLKIFTQALNENFENALAYSFSHKKNPNALMWPDPTFSKQPRSLYNELPWSPLYNFIDKETPISSAGSCFAYEISKKLQEDKFNYIIQERAPGHELQIASARWGIIFNAAALRQLVEKSFGIRTLPKLLWTLRQGDALKYYDPFREDIIFSSISEYEENFHEHLEACKQVFLKSKVFIITVGMTEIWRLKSDGSVFSRSPWNISPSLVERHVLSVDENIAELQKTYDILKTFNPDIKLIVSVSPVPLHATFRANDLHIISANCEAKATLRCAVGEFCNRNKDAYYFPSYETVVHCTENPWEEDQRHVSREAVAKVMLLFDKMFVAVGKNATASQNENTAIVA